MLIISNLTFLMQVVLSTTLSRLYCIAVGIQTLSVHQLEVNLFCQDQSKSFSLQPSLIYHLMCGPG